MSEFDRKPQIRFKGFTEPWEQRKLNNIVIPLGFKPYLASPIMNGKYMVIQQGNEPIVGYANGTPYLDYKNVVLFGDHTLSLYQPKSPFFIATDGIKILGKRIDINTFFLEYLMKKSMPNSEGYKRYFSIIKEIDVYTANSFAEQEKIGHLFKDLDSLITLHQRKCDKLKTIKASLLKGMFPEKGANTPKIRFKGFTEPWEQRKLDGLIAKGGSGGTPDSSNKSFYNGTIPFLGISDITNSDGIIYETEKHISNSGLSSSASWVVPKGAISLAMYASVGKVAILGDNIATSQAFFNMVFYSYTIRDYVYEYLKKMESDNSWVPLISTGTQANLNAEKVRNLLVTVPTKQEEMKKIKFLFAHEGRI
jgi:type I restriction enzyme S subunit